jgi:hypothetical protein
VNQAIPPAEAGLPRGRDAEKEQIDPELLELPDPPRRERSVTLLTLVVTAVASLSMAIALRNDAKYAFAEPIPDELGELAKAPPATFAENHHVHGRAVLGGANALRFERPFQSDTFRVSPVAGHNNIWAEVRVPAGAESGRYIPPTEFTGRLVRFDAAGPKERGIARAIEDATGQAVPQGAWLIVDGESPQSSKWAVALLALFSAFAIWNVLSAVKLVRKVK